MGNNQMNTLELIDTDQFMTDVIVVRTELESIGVSVKKMNEEGLSVGAGLGSFSKGLKDLFAVENLQAFASEVVKVRSEVSMLLKRW